MELGESRQPLPFRLGGGLAQSLARRVEAEGACSACYSELLHTLARLKDGGAAMPAGPNPDREFQEMDGPMASKL